MYLQYLLFENYLFQEPPSFAEAIQNQQNHIRWKICSNLPSALYRASVAFSGDTVYVAAGTAPDDATETNVYSYDVSTDKWTKLPRSNHCCGTLQIIDNRLSIFGGSDVDTNEVCKKVTTYNSETNCWYNYYPDMLNARFKLGVVTFNDYIIVMGGKSGSDTIHDSIEIMDYNYQLQWKEVFICLPVPMWSIHPTISEDSVTIIGYTSNEGRYLAAYQILLGDIILSLHSIFEISTNWKTLAPAPYYDTATVPYSNPPVIVGGNNDDGVTTLDISLYDRSENTWKKIGNLTGAKGHLGIALLSRNTIIVIGGATDGKNIETAKSSSLTTVEIGCILPINSTQLP